MPRATLPPKMEQWGAQVLGALPPRVQVRLSGKPPVKIDGDTLAPEAQLLLALLDRRREPPLETLSPADAREARGRLTTAYAGRPVPVASVRDFQIDAPVRIPARHYAPPESGGPHPLLVYYHGGGFTYGDLDSHDGACRILCRHGGAHVLAVDYRLAPEHRFPAAVDDAHAALDWAFAHAAEIGADPNRIGVGGDSAGGNLAAVVSQLARGGPAPALQLLIYPATDMTTRHRSRDLFANGFLLTDPEMDWYTDNYLGKGRTGARDPRASPLLAEDLSGLAPAFVVTAAFDPLRDEGESYAHALQLAGTPVTLRRFPGFIHGFVNAAGVSRTARDGLVEIAGVIRAMFSATTKGSAPPPGSP